MAAEIYAKCDAKVKEHIFTFEVSAKSTEREIFRKRGQSIECRQIHVETKSAL